MITKQMQKYGKVNLQAHGKASSSGDMYTAFIHFILLPQIQQQYAKICDIKNDIHHSNYNIIINFYNMKCLKREWHRGRGLIDNRLHRNIV